MAATKKPPNPYKYRIDFDNSSIVICSRLSKLLNKGDVEAERLMTKQRSLYPTFGVIIATQRKPNGNHTKFEMMIEHLQSWGKDDLANELLAMKNAKIKASVSGGGRMKQEYSFFHIRNRFYEMCEEHGLENPPKPEKRAS